MAQTTNDRESFWRHWCQYIPSYVDPYFEGESFDTIIEWVSKFAGRVRTGYFGRGNRVSCARVKTAIRAINQTCQLDRGKEPLYRAPEKYLKPLEITFAGFEREDEAPVPELAVPVGVPNQCVTVGQCSAASPKDQAIGDLVLIAFYYLLRVGEYTQKSKKKKTRTIQFRLRDIAFKNGNVLIPFDAPAAEFLKATAATMRLSNQKNGIRGSLIHRSAMRGRFCPVKALVRRFLHLRDNNALKDDIISSYYDHLGVGHVTDEEIRKAVKRAVIKLGLAKNGLTENRVGSHSLRAGGAMALNFAGAKRDTIKKFGRWSSDTFLLYIHDQIAEYSEGWTERMSVERSFFNLEGAYAEV